MVASAGRRRPNEFVRDAFATARAAACFWGVGTEAIGCCWVLMTLLFVGGVMNVLWIALLALLVLLEKLAPVGRWIARAAGIACVAAGAWLLVPSPQ